MNVHECLQNFFLDKINRPIRITPDGALDPRDREEIVIGLINRMRASGYGLKHGWTVEVWIDLNDYRLHARARNESNHVFDLWQGFERCGGSL